MQHAVDPGIQNSIIKTHEVLEMLSTVWKNFETEIDRYAFRVDGYFLRKVSTIVWKAQANLTLKNEY